MGRIQKGRISSSSKRKNNEKHLRRGAGKQMNQEQGTSANMYEDEEQGPSVVIDVEMMTPTTSRATTSLQKMSLNMDNDQGITANIAVGESQLHLLDHDYFGRSAILQTPRRGVNGKASPAALHMKFKRLRETLQQKKERLASERQRQASYRSDQNSNHIARRQNTAAARKAQNRKDGNGTIFNSEGKHRLGPMNVECRGCGGLHWKEEETQRNTKTFNDCCRHGKVQLPHIPPPTPLLLQLFQRSHPLSTNFFANIRALNSSMSFGSINPFPALYQGSRGPHCVKVQGLSSFLFNTSAQPKPGKQPAYPQLYIIDTAQATDIRIRRNPQIDRVLLESVGAEIKESNPIAQAFVMLIDEMEIQQQKADAEGTEIPDIQLHFVRPGQNLDPNTYNLPRTNEVAVVYIPGADNEAPETTVVVKPKDGSLKTLSSTNHMIDRIVYPLFFSNGTPNGWHVGAGCSRAEFVSFHLFRRRAQEGQPSGPHGWELNPILMGGDLTQQYVADNAVRVLSDRYKFATNNQEKLKGHLYTGPDKRMEKISAETGRPVGVKTILPATITGSPRWEAEQYKDVMAMMMHKGRPDLFVTLTCNPTWPEIKENLLPGQTANDDPVNVSRVFSLKLKALLQYLQHGGIEQNAVGASVFVPPPFGHVTAYVYVIEFQKRGLPHAHILLTLAKENKMITAKEVDAVISAQFPDETTDPELSQLVAHHMVHGPHTDTSQCMRESKHTGLPECRFKFPKEINEETTLNESGYVTYARPDNRRGIIRGGVFLDNRWVASYSPELLRRFDCHINVDRVFGAQSIKYLFKYLCKGADRASLVIDCDSNAPINHDEPRAALDTRYVGPAEGAWIILRKPIQDKSHSIVRMPVNLCRGDVGEDEEEVANSRMLSEYFALNEKDPNARTLLYHQIPEHYTWISKKWVQRKAHFNTLGRMRHISPSAGDIFYLRILLCHVVGAKSLDEILIYKGTPHTTFKDACIAMGLTQDDKEWEKAIEELCMIEMPALIRAYFARIMVHCMPAHPEALWEKFKDFMSEDFTRRGHSTAAAYNLALIDISRKLEDEGKNYFQFPGMPALTNPAENIVGADDIFSHRQECKNLAESGYSTLNQEQREAVNAILIALKIPLPNVEASTTEDVGGSNLFFVDGPGGTGKTTIYKLINYFLESNGKKVCNMAFSGIAATLLPRGRTMHNRLGLPVPLFSNSPSTIKPTSFKQRQELKETDIFIIDEISNVPKHAVGVMDNLLQIIMENSLPFGGKPVLWGGDFRQIPPVQRHATRAQLVALTVKNSKHWNKFKRFRLKKNMRVLPDELDFAKFLLTVGDGTANDENDYIHLPEQCHVQEDNVGDLDVEIFKDPIQRRDWKTVSERAILACLNEHVDEWNEKVMAMVPVDDPALDEATYYSIDKAESDGDHVNPDDYPTEFLNTLKPSGIPPHKLHLRVHATVQLTRNLAVCRGLSNGTRCEIVKFYERTIIVRVLTGPSAGSLEAIPRITLHCADEYPFTLARHQFPLKVSFAMTIHKSQGQTLGMVGVDLRSDVFTSGQLYVAFSRCRSWDSLRVLLPVGANRKVKNIVYKELLAD